mmetsp:Transcript_66337/g.183183  ORF Transcript_66337/g.183183 Transcript_66337/m.183183 type:complete len:326 (-) Transcript_66337:71-1048(-)
MNTFHTRRASTRIRLANAFRISLGSQSGCSATGLFRASFSAMRMLVILFAIAPLSAWPAMSLPKLSRNSLYDMSPLPSRSIRFHTSRKWSSSISMLNFAKTQRNSALSRVPFLFSSALRKAFATDLNCVCIFFPRALFTCSGVHGGCTASLPLCSPLSVTSPVDWGPLGATGVPSGLKPCALRNMKRDTGCSPSHPYFRRSLVNTSSSKRNPNFFSIALNRSGGRKPERSLSISRNALRTDLLFVLSRRLISIKTSSTVHIVVDMVYQRRCGRVVECSPTLALRTSSSAFAPPQLRSSARNHCGRRAARISRFYAPHCTPAHSTV